MTSQLQTMYDCVNSLVQNVPANAEVVAGYVTSNFAWDQQQWDRFSVARKVTICNDTSNAISDVLDVERGAATFADAPAWYDAQPSASGDTIPSCYVSSNNIPRLQTTMGNREYDLWVADWNNTPHLYPGSRATQYMSLGIYDLSVVEPDWPRKRGALPTSAPVSSTTTTASTARHLNAPVVALVVHPRNQGYWLVAADGGIFSFGGAPVFTDPLVTKALSEPVVGAAATSTGQGLYLVGADGGVFCFGDAAYRGSIPALGIEPAPEPAL